MNILIVDDEKVIRETTCVAIKAEGHQADNVHAGHVAMLKLKEEVYDLIFLDLRLGDQNGLDYLREINKLYPKTAVVVFTAHASVETAVEAMKIGAFDYLEKPFTPEQLRLIITSIQQKQKYEAKISNLEEQVQTQNPFPQFETEDPAMKKSLEILFRAAPTPASVLILGESGTGKSVIARAIHDRSHLKDMPFVTVSCPSLSRELLESELFGHVKGSFTGAVKDTWGKVAAAKGGTLFLDEIGELPLEIQPKLLRLLQEKQYERVGENKTRTAEVRVIAATNKDLTQSVKEGTFREDLLYRLDVISVTMLPLRKRPADLIRLSHDYLGFFAEQSNREMKGFSPEAEEALRKYSWPGNIRELRNIIERSVILCQGDTIQLDDLPDSVRERENTEVEVGINISLEELEKEHIKRVLINSETFDMAAQTLGIDTATLYRKRKKMGL